MELCRQIQTALHYIHILTQPDLSKQFLVEEDTSDSGVGAVLTQQDMEIFVHVFFPPHYLSPAKRNYNFGGFIVWTNHKTLAYTNGQTEHANKELEVALVHHLF